MVKPPHWGCPCREVGPLTPPPPPPHSHRKPSQPSQTFTAIANPHKPLQPSQTLTAISNPHSYHKPSQPSHSPQNHDKPSLQSHHKPLQPSQIYTAITNAHTALTNPHKPTITDFTNPHTDFTNPHRLYQPSQPSQILTASQTMHRPTHLNHTKMGCAGGQYITLSHAPPLVIHIARDSYVNFDLGGYLIMPRLCCFWMFVIDVVLRPTNNNKKQPIIIDFLGGRVCVCVCVGGGGGGGGGFTKHAVIHNDIWYMRSYILVLIPKDSFAE